MFYNEAAACLVILRKEENLMNSLDQTVEAHLEMIQNKTGKTLGQMAVIIQRSGLSKHGEIRNMLHREMGLSYSDADILTQAVLESDNIQAAQVEALPEDQILDKMYTG
jgi:hypothetical protein